MNELDCIWSVTVIDKAKTKKQLRRVIKVQGVNITMAERLALDYCKGHLCFAHPFVTKISNLYPLGIDVLASAAAEIEA